MHPCKTRESTVKTAGSSFLGSNEPTGDSEVQVVSLTGHPAATQGLGLAQRLDPSGFGATHPFCAAVSSSVRCRKGPDHPQPLSGLQTSSVDVKKHLCKVSALRASGWLCSLGGLLVLSDLGVIVHNSCSVPPGIVECHLPRLRLM